MSDAIRYLSICGMLGYGYPTESLVRGLSKKPDFVAVDSGSTDPGPFYLGSGEGFVKELQIRRDLEPLLQATVERNIPLIIGSAGGSGARPHVDSFLNILTDIAKRHDLHFKLAVIYADLDRNLIRRAWKEGNISPCGPVPELNCETIDKCCNPVGQMGTEPIIEALREGADVIIVGRCCDTAIFAAYPILRGFDPGLAMHCAKIAECGALCARPAGANDALYCELHHDHFTVEPVNSERKCTPESVAGHSLYEQPNPECFYEPEGKIDMTNSTFEQVSERAVKVSGTRLCQSAKTTLKIEAAELKGFRSITLAGIRDPLLIQNFDLLCSEVRKHVQNNVETIINERDYQLIFRCYGINAATWSKEALPDPLPREIGLVIEVIAPTQEMAANIVSLARSTALHQAFPGRKTTAGNLAFPFSPSDFKGGPVYEFSLYHLMEVENFESIFSVNYMNIGRSEAK